MDRQKVNIIQHDAQSYSSLLSKEYVFYLGLKGSTEEFEIHIRFDKTMFAHLSGLGQIKDVPWLKRMRATEIYEMALLGKLKEERIKRASQNAMTEAGKDICDFEKHYTRDKLYALQNLEYMLDNYRIVFYCKEIGAKKDKSGNIIRHGWRALDAEMFICKKATGLTFYLVFKREDIESKSSEYAQISFRTYDRHDMDNPQTTDNPRKMEGVSEAYLRRTVKIDHDTGEETEVYVMDNYEQKETRPLVLP